MALALAELIILGLLVDYIFRKMHIPGLVGMMLTGVLLGPFVLSLLDPGLLAFSTDMRMIALIVILLRAGFELHKDTLRRVGLQALLLSFVPATLEALAVMALGPRLLGLTRLESAILGTVLGAVSPAVVVPMMLDFAARRKGTDQGIPTLVIAASSIDDVFVIVVFSTLLGLYTGSPGNLLWKLTGIPVSIVSGILTGLAFGWILYRLFRRFNPRATKRLLTILGVSIVLVGMETRIESVLPFAALLAVMAIGFIILEKNEHMAHEISGKLSKVWVFAQILLFTLVGAQVDIHVAWQAGLAGSTLIGLALLARSAGTWLCLLGSRLSPAERFFVVIAYLPKATVQAAIGGAPLVALRAAGMPEGPGEIILAAAVLSILLTAAPGAWLIAWAGNRFLKTEPLGPASGETADEMPIAAWIPVADAMDPDVASVRDTTPMRQVFDGFSSHPYGICPVLDARGNLTGLVRLSTLRPLLAKEDLWPSLIAADVAEPAPLALHPAMPLKEAIALMDRHGFRDMSVVEPGTRLFVGILSRERAEQTAQEVWLRRAEETARPEGRG
ncbi:MAG: CBS domain-containing protein [Lentisphaerae bacterium]|nr:CBS domain-containing protein [Lentisphaerota bacterium]